MWEAQALLLRIPSFSIFNLRDVIKKTVGNALNVEQSILLVTTSVPVVRPLRYQIKSHQPMFLGICNVPSEHLP